MQANDRATDCYSAVLTILSVSEDDASEYIFFVKNSKGVHEGTIFVNITQASYSVSVSTSRAYGDSHHISSSPSSSASRIFHHSWGLTSDSTKLVLLSVLVLVVNYIGVDILMANVALISIPSTLKRYYRGSLKVDESTKAQLLFNFLLQSTPPAPSTLDKSDFVSVR